MGYIVKHMLIQGLAALCLSLASVAATAGIIVSFDPQASGPQTVNDTFSVGIVGTPGSGQSLVGGAIDLAFDPTVVHVLGVSVNTALFTLSNSDGTIDNGAGTVSDILFAELLDFPSGSFTIATVSFKAFGEGTSNLKMTDDKSHSVYLWTLSELDDDYVIDPTFEEGSIEVQAAAMPEPPMMILMVATFGLLGLQRWRHKGEPNA